LVLKIDIGDTGAPTFPTAPTHHQTKSCAGKEQKVRSKTSSAAHLFKTGKLVMAIVCKLWSPQSLPQFRTDF
jgi:hypothetical protein